MAKKKAASKKAASKKAASSSASQSAPQQQEMPPQNMMQGGAMNPMQMMQQMMQMMAGGQMMGGAGMGGMGAGGGWGSMVDESAAPFTAQAGEDEDDGLGAEMIRPATLAPLVREQQAIPAQPLLDTLCLTPEGKPLGGLPQGCTIAFIGPPGKGKSRTCLEVLARIADSGTTVGYIVAEEGFRDPYEGRNDLCSRMAQVGMEVLGKTEKQIEKTLENVVVLEATYHKGLTWDEFIARYRSMVERHGVEVMIVDSLNMLDPTKRHTADNLSTLKTYNHEHGVTCLCVGQIKDTGDPQGGESLVHTADCVFLLEEMSLGSKDIAEFWGGTYREKIDIIRAVKCVTTKTFPHPVRVTQDSPAGTLAVHPDQPAAYALPE